MAVPQKIVLKSTTKISLNDRFTNIMKTKPVVQQTVRANMATQQQASAKNRRLAQQMANRPTTVNAAMKLKKRSLQQRLGKSNIKSRLSLDAPVSFQPMRGGLGRGRGRGRGQRGRGQSWNRGRGGGGANMVAQSSGFPVSRGGPRGRRARGARGGRGRGVSVRGGRGGIRQSPKTGPFVRGRGGRGRGLRGRGGRGRGAGTGRGRGAKTQPVSRETLDNQLDEYMSHAKGSLDAQLDAYMAHSEGDL